jgi:hypothetical protein
MAGKTGGTFGAGSLGASLSSIPQEGTAAYDTYIQAQQSKYLSPDFAKQLAAMAKAYPAASVGTVMGLTKSGAVIGGNTANAMTTLDGSALIDAQRNAAIAAAAKLKEQNSAKKGSPADFLAPLTRTAFMLLSTPFEMLEATVRNGVSGKGGMNVLDETQTGQALINLFKTGKIDVGTGFLGADQNSAVGKALLNAKIAAGPTMKGGVPWTYSSGLTQALFDNPETKAARTFQAISGFVLNLAADPLTYVPGVGLLKIGKEAGKVGVTLRVGPKAAARAAEAKAAPIKAVARDVEDVMGDVSKVRAEARAAAGDINMLEADIIKHQDDLNTIAEKVDNTYQTYYKSKSEADLLDAEYGQLRQQRDTLIAGLKSATDTKGQLVGQARKAEDLMAHRIELNTAGRAAEVQSILDAKGFDEVVRAGETLLEQEQLAPGLIHTLEEAALKKGDRASTQGIRNGVDAVVRVAAKQKPRLIKWTALIKAGDSPQATRVSNEIGSNLIDVGTAAGIQESKLQGVLDVIDTPGATHAELIASAQKAGLVEQLFLAYERAGIQGFENVGATRGMGGGGYAYFPRTVDPFDAKISDFGRFKADAINSPDINDLGVQALTTKGAITQQVTGLVEGAAAPRLTVMEQLANVNKELAEMGKVTKGVQKELDKAEAAWRNNLKYVQDRVKSDDEARILLEEARGRKALAMEAEFGLMTIGGKQILDYQQAAKAFFGPMGQNAAKFIAVHYGPEQYDDLWRAMNGNITVDLAKRLAAATSEKEVMGLLAGEVGLELSRGTRVGLAVQSRAIQFQSSFYAPNSLKLHHEGFANFLLNAENEARMFLRSNKVTAPFTRFAPTRNLVHLDDVDTLVKEMNDTLPFLKASPELQKTSIKAMMAATTSTERFNVFIDTLKSLVKEKAPNLTEEQIRMLNDAARVFKKEADANRKFLAQVAGKDIGTREFKVAGKTQKFTQLDPLIDSQLANFVKWPDIDSIRQLTGKTRNLFSQSQNAQQLRTVTTDLFDSFFKQTVLVGRVSYILRNIGDMQVRSFLGGSTTLFNHPLQFAAMMMANPEGNAIAKFATRWSRFDNTVFGTNFNKAVEEMDAIGFKSAALADADKFAVMMSRSIGVGMGQGTRGLSQILPTGMRFITPAERGFNRAWAGAILQFRESAMARLVAGGLDGGIKGANGKITPWFKEAEAFIAKKQAQGMDLSRDYEKFIVDFMFETQQGVLLRTQIAKVDELNRALMLDADETIARQAMENYFKVVKEGVDNLSGGRQELRDFISGRAMVAVDGKRTPGFNPKGTQSKDVWLANILKGYVDSTDISKAIGQLKLPTDDVRAVASFKGQWDRAASKFFQVSASIEKRAALGPEFKQQYWNGVAENLNLMTKDEATKILAIAEKELRGIKVFGLKAGFENPALVRMREAIKTLDDRGLAADDMHTIANNFAANKLQKLYYDAMRQKQYAVAARLVAPFAAAWGNTIATWSKLIGTDVANTFRLQGKARTYKAANAFEFLTHPETGVIYEWTGQNWNDPSQGFIYKDPTYGDPRMVIPLAGNALGWMLSTATGEAVPSMPTSLSIPSLNLAFSNELLPGVGPAIQLSLGRLIQSQEGWAADQLRDVIYPFGAPSGKTGIVESFTPAWAQRVLYGLGINSFEEKSVSTLRPLMTYLASTGNYGDFPLGGEAQAKLLEDAGRVNRVLALWRGITQNVAPGSIAPQILAKDKEGELHVQALMFNDFLQIRANNPDSYEIAVAKWADKYGESALFALVSGSRGGITPTDEAWNFYQNNRKDANAYSNAFALFFPGGQYSQEFAKWQEQRGQRFKLSPAEMQMEAARYVYTARKAKLQSDEAIAVQQGADPKQAHQVYMTRKAAMDDDFGGQPDFRAAGVPRETLVKEVTQALSNPKFAETESGKGLAKFLQARESALNSVAEAGYKTLTGKAVENVAQWLDQTAYQIISEHPDFSVMYWRVFATETGNN